MFVLLRRMSASGSTFASWRISASLTTAMRNFRSLNASLDPTMRNRGALREKSTSTQPVNGWWRAQGQKVRCGDAKQDQREECGGYHKEPAGPSRIDLQIVGVARVVEDRDRLANWIALALRRARGGGDVSAGGGCESDDREVDGGSLHPFRLQALDYTSRSQSLAQETPFRAIGEHSPAHS